jgi:positive regulator of sigma E activity
MEISAFLKYILPFEKCLIANLLKYLCGSVEQCLFYTLGLKVASYLAIMRYSNGGTLGIGRFVFIGGTVN